MEILQRAKPVTLHHCDLRKYSFTVRDANLWNNLPESLVSADTI